MYRDVNKIRPLIFIIYYCSTDIRSLELIFLNVAAKHAKTMIRNIKQALDSPPAFKLTCYVCISPGMVQESAGKMAKEGEKQPKQCPWTRKGWYNHSKRQRILRKFKFHSLWQLRYNTNSVSQLQLKLLDKGCTKSGVHFATTGKQQPWIQLVWPNTPTLSSTTANYRLSESIFNSNIKR